MPLKDPVAKRLYMREYLRKRRQDPEFRRIANQRTVESHQKPEGKRKHLATAARYRENHPERVKELQRIANSKPERKRKRLIRDRAKRAALKLARGPRPPRVKSSLAKRNNPEWKKAYNRAYREKNRERLHEYEKNRVRPPESLERHKEYRKQWALDNKEHVREKNQKWYKRVKADPEKDAHHLKTQNEYRRKHPEESSRRNKAYWAKHPERYKLKSKTSNIRRKAREKNAQGTFNSNQWLSRFNLYGGRCAYCSCSVTLDSVHIDHVIPLSLGGSNWPSNLVPACAKCNLKKGARVWKSRLPQSKES